MGPSTPSPPPPPLGPGSLRPRDRGWWGGGRRTSYARHPSSPGEGVGERGGEGGRGREGGEGGEGGRGEGEEGRGRGGRGLVQLTL